MALTHLRARILPLALGASAGAAWVAAGRLAVWTEDGPGSGLMPKIALGLIVGLACLVAIRPGAGVDAEETGSTRTFAIYAVSAVTLALAVPYLGFVLPALAAVFVIMRFAEHRSWTASSVYAVLLIATIVLSFGTALKVQFPDGPAERALKTIGAL